MQTNSIASSIAIVQSGDLLTASGGIYAEIDNQAIGGFLNTAQASNANGTVYAVGGSDISQSIDITQTNALTSSISVDNSAAVDGAVGISALISNHSIGDLANTYTLAGNGNGGASVVSVGDSDQSVAFTQVNDLTSNIQILNSAAVDASQMGIQALIDNASIGNFSNSAGFANTNGGAAVIIVDSLKQSGSIGQTNAIESEIDIVNSSSLGSDGGISAEINNSSIGNLYNTISAANATGSAAVLDNQDLTQAIAFRQANVVSSDIAIINSGKVTASGTGIDLIINNEGLQLDNTARFSSSSTSRRRLVETLRRAPKSCRPIPCRTASP